MPSNAGYPRVKFEVTYLYYQFCISGHHLYSISCDYDSISRGNKIVLLNKETV